MATDLELFEAFATAIYAPSVDPKLAYRVDGEYTEVLTMHRTFSLRGAACKAVADYLGALSINSTGRAVKFALVYGAWAVPENTAIYPSAMIQSAGNLTYNPDNSDYNPDDVQRFAESTNAYFVANTIEMVLEVNVMATNEREREVFATMLEDAFTPSSDYAGFRLVVPYYHGQVMAFVPTLSYVMNSDDSNIRGYRQLTFNLAVSAQQIRLLGPVDTLKTVHETEVR